MKVATLKRNHINALIDIRKATPVILGKGHTFQFYSGLKSVGYITGVCKPNGNFIVKDGVDIFWNVTAEDLIEFVR